MRFSISAEVLRKPPEIRFVKIADDSSCAFLLQVCCRKKL
jgi:hypothetical protein